MEEIIFDDYDECEIENASEMKAVKQHRYSSAFRKCALALALAVAVSTGFTAVPGKFNNMATVEAAKKKDKKKPVIKFAGSSKIETEVNKSVKIPKTTAKDNKDGNVTKKIAVKVTKGKKQFKTIAKKIKSNKAVTFTSTGNYVITYTVKDKAGNKATKKRYVTVKEAQKEQTTRRPVPATTEAPTTQTVTEAPTTTEIPTTEAPTTEALTTEKEIVVYPTPADYSKYNIKEYTIDGRKFKITNDETFMEKIHNGNPETKEDMANITFKIDNFCYFCLDKNTLDGSFDFLKYFGNIKAYDEYGNDVSNSIVIYSSLFDDSGITSKYDCIVTAIYVENSLGKGQLLYFTILIKDFNNQEEMDMIKTYGFEPLDSDSTIYIQPHQY